MKRTLHILAAASLALALGTAFAQGQGVERLQKMADLLVREKAQLWINHDKAQRDTLKLAPAYYG